MILRQASSKTASCITYPQPEQPSFIFNIQMYMSRIIFGHIRICRLYLPIRMHPPASALVRPTPGFEKQLIYQQRVVFQIRICHRPSVNLHSNRNNFLVHTLFNSVSMNFRIPYIPFNFLCVSLANPKMLAACAKPGSNECVGEPLFVCMLV